MSGALSRVVVANDMKSSSKGKYRVEAQAIVLGLKKHCSKQTITVNGEGVQVAEIIKLFDESLAAIDETAKAESQWHHALQRERAKLALVKPMIPLLRTFVSNQFGVGSPTFAEFGFQVPKVGRKSAAVKARAAAKQVATRAENHPKRAAVLKLVPSDKPSGTA